MCIKLFLHYQQGCLKGQDYAILAVFGGCILFSLPMLYIFLGVFRPIFSLMEKCVPQINSKEQSWNTFKVCVICYKLSQTKRIFDQNYDYWLKCLFWSEIMIFTERCTLNLKMDTLISTFHSRFPFFTIFFLSLPERLSLTNDFQLYERRSNETVGHCPA